MYGHLLTHSLVGADGWTFTAQVLLIVCSELSVTGICTQVSGPSGPAPQRQLSSHSSNSHRNSYVLRVRPSCSILSLALGAKEGIIARLYIAPLLSTNHLRRTMVELLRAETHSP